MMPVLLAFTEKYREDKNSMRRIRMCKKSSTEKV